MEENEKAKLKGKKINKPRYIFKLCILALELVNEISGQKEESEEKDSFMQLKRENLEIRRLVDLDEKLDAQNGPTETPNSSKCH